LKARFIVVFVSVILGSLILFSAVYAQWTALGSGYAIASNVHGIDILPGTRVTVTAGTTDPDVVNVTFRWHRPPDGNGPVAWEDEVFPLLTSPYPPPNVPQEVIDYENSTTVWYAQDTRVPDELGDWGVQAFFIGPDGKDRANLTDVIMIRATSFNSVPEIPFGTIAAAAAMFIAFGLFIIKKKRIPRIVHRVN
jgi:hypothetical protein